ncbi:G patch domain-containing protein 1 [Bulinus truncatus]|nr:G patch domain-containing protein 1 [Bulinus truncatus]
MAASSDDQDEDDFVLIGTPVPELSDDQPLQKPTTIQDLTARDKEGRRRFHGAFTGGFSAGYFNTVGSKEGFAPSTFSSSRNKRFDNAERTSFRPEDFMDDEDLEEHGIAPRKFTTVTGYTSEESTRKLLSDASSLASASGLDITPAIADLIVPEQIPVGVRLLQKMGWREGQGLGPRKRKKKKKSVKTSNPSIKTYGCALPSSDDQSDSDEFVPINLEDIKFAPKDVCPISLNAKDDVHGLGYHGIDASLALPGSHINLFQQPKFHNSKNKKGIRGEAFGVGVFEEEDENIYAIDSLSNYDLTMKLDEEEDNKFGWTAPRQHGKQSVPVTYVGKLLEGFCLSSKPLQPKKKYPPPTLPHNFKPQHWFRKKRVISHLPHDLKNDDQNMLKNLTAVDRGLLLGETPIMKSVFDLVPKEDIDRIEATKTAIAMTQSLKDKAKDQLSSKFRTVNASGDNSQELSADRTPSLFLSKFKPAESAVTESEFKDSSSKAPLFQGSLNFQPFRKDPAKQERYDKFLSLLKQEVKDPYLAVASSHMTEWEKSREKEEFSKAAKIYRPMSAMMSARFVRGSMIDDEQEKGSTKSVMNDVNDQVKAAELGMFGQLTHEVFEWHPNSLLCKRFNVPNPYPGSDIVGLPSVKRDKFSVFNFLNFNDYQPQETEPSSEKVSVPVDKTLKPEKKTMASVFKVLDDPTFNEPIHRRTSDDNSEHTEMDLPVEETSVDEQKEVISPDMDLFRAIFKNSDSEDSDDEVVKEDKLISSSDDERSDKLETDIIKDKVINIKKADIEITHSDEKLKSSETLKEIYSGKSFTEDSSLRSPTWRKKTSIFSVLDEIGKEGVMDENIHSNSALAQKEDVLSRLSVPSEIQDETSDVEYGPKLPSYLNDSNRLSADNSVPIIPQVPASLDRKNDKHKGSKKHKKDKKKKSKHKKKHKKHKKSSKTKKVRKDDSSSGDEADTESESDNSDNSNLKSSIF